MSSIPKSQYVVQLHGDPECKFISNTNNQENCFSSLKFVEEYMEKLMKDSPDLLFENFGYTIYEIHLTKIKEVIYT